MLYLKVRRSLCLSLPPFHVLIEKGRIGLSQGADSNWLARGRMSIAQHNKKLCRCVTDSVAMFNECDRACDVNARAE